MFIALGQANVALAQVLPSSGPTNFPMLGITRGQTLLLHLVAFPPVPCTAQLGVQDSNGNLVALTQTMTLAGGQSAELAVNGNSLTSVFGHRVELLPTVTGPDGALPGAACVATAEVIDNAFGATMALVPGATGYPPVPVFGMLGLTLSRTLRLNVVAYPPDPCIGQISFADRNGNPIGAPRAVQLSAGSATFLDLPGSAVVTAFGQRAAVRPVVTLATGACIASAEVYDNLTGVTAVYYPPNPCAPSSTSCVAF